MDDFFNLVGSNSSTNNKAPQQQKDSPEKKPQPPTEKDNVSQHRNTTKTDYEKNQEIFQNIDLNMLDPSNNAKKNENQNNLKAERTGKENDKENTKEKTKSNNFNHEDFDFPVSQDSNNVNTNVNKDHKDYFNVVGSNKGNFEDSGLKENSSKPVSNQSKDNNYGIRINSEPQNNNNIEDYQDLLNLNSTSSSKPADVNQSFKDQHRGSMMDGLGDIFNKSVDMQDQNIKSANNSFIADDFTKNMKNQTEIDLISDKVPEYELKDRIDKILEKWSMGVSEPKNLLLLLASLHEVWSKDDKLKDISVKEMVDDSGKASRIYRKAMLLFHDDKIKKYSFKEHYVAKSLYYILTKAHEEYREK
eukprot:CAMPEP_0170524024 /NCGR_PEP_ID=MMETSP0209-20121228/9465_1 /TAXON_ID=665100 ORGANISM="Litonotus pictus, Strain P1" /NCGR_SAMPLE_ID=MMETSP0209 /ASSEMBLY_ACC=CAM_ASM_000301 /LENGTH=359 /DNA_ID=CAMNT_0010812487 /DNA_START=314 /DNA_END=1390 /DNA_ORIENTATION=+